MPRSILIVEDDDLSVRLLRAILLPEGYELTTATDGLSAVAALANSNIGVVILDLRLPDMDGLEVLKRIRTGHPSLPVIILTAFGEVRSAVESTKLGAFDYLTKPIEHDQLLFSVARAFETHELRTEVAELRRSQGSDQNLATTMGHSDAVKQVIAQVQTVARTTFSVLLTGETGTGKELVAQAIHRTSDRHAKPFIAVDCGAIPESLIESELFGYEKGAFTGANQRRQGHFRGADGGTLLLDEIGNLPLRLQAKLLRVLESRTLQSLGANRASPLDVRVIAATNRNLESLAAAGRFRADLYFRLAQFTIALPPLRQRRADIPELAQRCLEEVSIELRRPMLQIARDAMAALQRYDWPGNVRELRNVVRQAVLESSDLTLKAAGVNRLIKVTDVPNDDVDPSKLPPLRDAARQAAREAERRVITQALRRTGGNQSQAARLLKTDYKTLYVKMKGLGIRPQDFTG